MGWCCDLPHLWLKSKNGSLISCLDSFSSRALCCSRLELEFFVFLGTSTCVLWLGLPFLLLCSDKKAKPKKRMLVIKHQGEKTLYFH